jgi:putative ABC transport system substrate-binding protein
MKNIFSVLLVVAVAVVSTIAEAQQQAKIPKIGYLGVRPDDSTTAVELFRREFRALGYVEGKNFTFEYRNAENQADRLPALVDELIRLKVDVLIVAAPNEARVASKATKTIPIVGANLGDPVASGLVESFARPGGNITGFASIATLPGKRLEILKDAIPKLARVAVLWHRQPTATAWKEHEIPARELALQLYSMEVNSKDKFEGAFKEAIKARSGALSVSLSPLINSNQQQIAELAAKYRLPAIYPRREFVDSGGLMSYGADREEPFKRIAVMVDKILKGTKPPDIPVEQPMKFEFIINLKAAKQIGLTIPPNVLVRADKVIR